MLHSKFHGHWPFGSGEEDFLRFLPYMYMGKATILVMWPEPFEQTFVPPSQGGSIWNLASIGPVVSEEMFENVDIQHTHIRTTEAYLYYKLTNEPKDSGTLKMPFLYKIFRQNKMLCQLTIPSFIRAETWNTHIFLGEVNHWFYGLKFCFMPTHLSFNQSHKRQLS